MSSLFFVALMLTRPLVINILLKFFNNVFFSLHFWAFWQILELIQRRFDLMPILQDLSVSLFELVSKEKFVFCSWEPASLDSTTLAKLFIKLTIKCMDGRVYNLNINASNALLFQKILQKINDTKTIAWIGFNWKDVFTFFQRVTGQRLILKGIVDLAWFESYLRLETTESDYRGQLSLFKQILKNQQIWGLYKQVYEPLISNSIPSMESYGLVNDNIGQVVFPNYHIEGQENGRLSCSCNFKRCYNPHSLGEDEKVNLLLKDDSYKFLSFDYRNMEVTVLANLANDDILLDIIKNKNTFVYETIFEMITNVKNHEQARIIGKKMFLPCIYGQGEAGLANSLDISREQASIYIQKLHTTFKKSFEFVESQQKKAHETNEVVDFFGRKRKLKKEDSYKARNFSVQSPAAMLCLEALNNLQSESNQIYKIVFHVHDGYCIAAHDKHLQEAYLLAKKTLVQKSKFMDIELSVSSKVGKNLNKMVSIGK